MVPTETGLVIPVASLQAFVSEWRPKVDRIAPVGVPAHVTLLYPFVEPAAVDGISDNLRSFFSAWPPFTYSLADVGWFGEDVVFVRPVPAAPFTDLTNAIAEKWGLPPYAGEITDPQPHITIGFDGRPEDMRRVAAAASELLPIDDQVADEVWLMQGSADPPSWTHTHSFRLGQT